MIARGIPDAQVEVHDYTGGGDHFEALVVSRSSKAVWSSAIKWFTERWATRCASGCTL